MSIDSKLFLDSPASRHALRDVLVQADIGLNEVADFEHLSQAVSASTTVSIRDDLSSRVGRLDNGVAPTRLVTFRFRREDWIEYNTQTVRGVMALLRAFPDADAYWVDLDAEYPTLLCRGGHLVLAQQRTEPDDLWDPASEPSYVAMVDLPYTIAPLGPWNFIEE
jgi:hypothetical protein